MKNLKLSVLAVAGIFAITSCSKDEDPQVINEVEVLTTITAVFTPVGGGSTVTLTSKDLDGDGPTAPTVTVSGPFAINKTYNGELTVLDESKTPAENKMTEILSEGLDHQFFYQKTGTLPNFTYTPIASAANNFDSSGRPIGFRSVLVTGATAATGTLRITLIHEGNKSAPNVANGDITNAGGETDIEVNFTGITVN